METAHPPCSLSAEDQRAYWRQNRLLMVFLLSIWAFVGLGCGILFADSLNTFRLGGYPLGFWFAQQGAIFIFVLTILIYCCVMNRLDARYSIDTCRD